MYKNENDQKDEKLASETLRKRYRILVVEDDFIAIKFLGKVLSVDYIVNTAVKADSALELASKNEYDVLMLDINLGRGMNGIELLQELRKIAYYKDVPAIAVTAYASEEDKHEFLSRGFTHFLSKPFLSEELKRLLNKILE